MAKDKHKLKLTIEYTIDVEDLHTEEVLDKLREAGEAEIVDVELLKFDGNRK